MLSFALGLVALMLVTACEPPARFPAPGEPRYRVLIAGDSLTIVSPAAQQNYVGYAYVEAAFGRAMVQPNIGQQGAIEVLPRVAQVLNPKVIVMELGTNDVLSKRPMADVFADAERLIAALPTSATLVWVASATDREPERAAEFDTWLRGRVGIVVPFDQWVISNPGHFPDGVHPDEVGIDALWRLVAETLRTVHPA